MSISRESTFTWATVTDLSPLRLRLDGDASELPITPDVLVAPDGLAVDDRVRCELSGNRVIAFGRAGGVPASWMSTATMVTPSDGGTYSMTGREYMIIVDSPVSSYTIEFPASPAVGHVVRLMFLGAIPDLTITHDADFIVPDLTETPEEVSTYAWAFADVGGVGIWVGVTNPVVDGGGGGAVIDDGTTSTLTVWSSDKTSDEDTASRARANHTGTQSADTIVDGSTNHVFTAADDTKLTGIASGATANSSDATLLARANHTGTQSADTIVDGSTNHVFTAADDTKLGGIASGATANDTDANLKARANHTGTQLAATISDFSTAADARALVLIDDVTPSTSKTWSSDRSLAVISAVQAYAIDRANHTGTQSADTVVDGTTNHVFTAADDTKLAGIEALADVTDATNVDAAGAVMNSDTTTAGMSFVIDEDSFTSDLATKVPTQQSTKAYVAAFAHATVVTPTNGGTYNITGHESMIVFDHAAPIAAFTVVFPATPAVGDRVRIWSTSAISALTVTHSADLMTPQPTTIAGIASSLYEWVYFLSGATKLWWGVMQPATTSAPGYVEGATSAETITGTDPDRFVTPAGLTAKIDDLGWIAATLGNSWTNSVTAGYRKANGRVTLRGRITGGTTNTAFTLPAGYRPSQALTFGQLSGTSGSTMCTVTISTGGAVAVTSGTVPNLDGITFFNS